MAKDPARSSKTFLNRDSHHVTRSLCSCLITHTSEQFDNNSVLQTRANFPATAEGFFLVPSWFLQVAHQARTPAGGYLQPGDGVLAQRAAEEQTLCDFPGRGRVRRPALCFPSVRLPSWDS